MDIEIPEKTYFRIGEVSKILGVEPYVVRYWETEFKTVKPIRTKSEQRLYRRKDLEELALGLGRLETESGVAIQSCCVLHEGQPRQEGAGF